MSGARPPCHGRVSLCHPLPAFSLLRTALGSRYEDNFDAVNNLFVCVRPAEKSKIEARRGCHIVRPHALC